jgi:hypothetical protein
MLQTLVPLQSKCRYTEYLHGEDYELYFRQANVKSYKLKVARRGLYSTAALYIADCALAHNVVPSFISRGATTPSSAGALY